MAIIREAGYQIVLSRILPPDVSVGRRSSADEGFPKRHSGGGVRLQRQASYNEGKDLLSRGLAYEGGMWCMRISVYVFLRVHARVWLLACLLVYTNTTHTHTHTHTRTPTCFCCFMIFVLLFICLLTAFFTIMIMMRKAD